jgi:hypothetical protein
MAMSASEPKAKTQTALWPHLVARNCAKAIEFYKAAFGATEDFRLVEKSGKIGHAELHVGDAHFMLADEYPDFGALSPASVAVGGSISSSRRRRRFACAKEQEPPRPLRNEFSACTPQRLPIHSDTLGNFQQD